MNKPSWIGHALGGRYRIEELLGQGGMSAVYKANDPNLRRMVAVKLIHSHLSDDPEFVRRFEVEAAAVAQLRHPNIIQVFDFDSEGETYYMVLEFVPGETLQMRLQRLNEQNRRMPMEEVVNVGSSVADAIDYAHKRGMIHRDIKPANVMLNVQGEAILMDFGIAKMVGETHFTATGAVLGTALYMAPEQIRGERPDHRVDIYSLGVMLYEMVSGTPPFEADSAMTVMMMHLNDPVPELTALNPETPGLLKRIIEKALSKDPEERFASASDMARALRSQLKQLNGEGEATEMFPPTRPGQGETVADSTPHAGPPQGAQTPATPSNAAGSSLEPARGAVAGAPPAQPPSRRASPPAGGGAFPASSAGAMSGVGALIAGLSGTQLAIIGGGLLLLAALVTTAVILLGSGNGEQTPPTASDLAAAATQTAQALALIPATETPEVVTPTVSPTPTDTPTPTQSPTPTLTPTATVPSEPYVRINDVGISDDHYVVIYETFGYTEALPGMHIHFFWDTVSEDDAGVPGNGPWTLYGGPRPFEEFSWNSAPPGATQICARVANPNHSIIPGSGNCFDIPGLEG